jgi:hypothetical protein
MKRKEPAKLPLSRETLQHLGGATWLPRLASEVNTTCVTLNACPAGPSVGCSLT